MIWILLAGVEHRARRTEAHQIVGRKDTVQSRMGSEHALGLVECLAALVVGRRGLNDLELTLDLLTERGFAVDAVLFARNTFQDHDLARAIQLLEQIGSMARRPEALRF